MRETARPTATLRSRTKVPIYSLIVARHKLFFPKTPPPDKREGYTCDMLILSNRIQRLTFFAVFSVGWFNVALSRADEKAVLVLHGDRLSIPAVKATDQGLMAALSRGQSQVRGAKARRCDRGRLRA